MDSNFAIFKLLDRKKDEDSFFLNEDGSQDFTRPLDFTNSYGILNPFFYTEDKGGRVFQRYIKGCATFGIESQKNYVASLETTLIEFNKGADMILSKSLMGPLIEFLKIHPWNPESLYHNPEIHEARFYMFKPEVVRKQEISKIEAEDRAFEVLRLLRDDKERMRAVALLFEGISSLEDDGDVYLALREVAKNDSENFINSIASKEKSVLSDVLIALKLGVIQKNAKEFFYSVGEGVISDAVGKDANDKLAKFLMTKEGEVHYKNILLAIGQKELELNAEKGNN